MVNVRNKPCCDPAVSYCACKPTLGETRQKCFLKVLDGYLHSEAAVFSYFQESDTLFSIRKDLELFGTCTFVIGRSRSVNVDVRSSKRILFLSCMDMGPMLHFFMTILYGGSAKTSNCLALAHSPEFPRSLLFSPLHTILDLQRRSRPKF